MNTGQNTKRLLSDVYLEQRCNVCGETYPLTLYEILLEQRASKQWQSPRPHGETGVGYEALLRLVPQDQLEALASAWDHLLTTLDAKGLTLRVGTPPTHVHPEGEHH